VAVVVVVRGDQREVPAVVDSTGGRGQYLNLTSTSSSVKIRSTGIDLGRGSFATGDREK